MEGRRVQKSAPRHNPLFLIFIGLCAAVLALAVLSVILSVRLSTVNKELKLAQSRLEQYDSGAALQGGAQEGQEGDDRVPGDDIEATDPSGSAPVVGSDTNTDNETEVKVGWLDLTGHKEVQVAPESVFDKYYTYYTTNGVNLRSGPGTDYDRITLLDLGTEVKGAAKEGGWTFVGVNGKFGWVSSDYLSTTKPEPVQKVETPQPPASSEPAETPSNEAENTPFVPAEEQEIPGWLLP